DSVPDLVQELVSGVSDIVTAQDSNILGLTDVYLEGERSAVRTEETNLGNLTADANLVAAQAADETVVISLKNGGGIRSAIGEVDSVDGTLLPPQANPVSGREEGEISELEVANSLRFNNGLTLLTLTADEILQVLEHAVAETGDGNTPGQFAQIGGISFSFDASQAVGDRVISAAVTDEDGSIVDVLVDNGELVGDTTRTFRIVTLNFLANGGDDYPFSDFEAANPDRVNRVDLSDLDADGETDEVFTGNAAFAPDGTEQDALAEFLIDNFNTPPFADAETPVEEDTRIQNLAFRDDTVLDGSSNPPSSSELEIGLFDADSDSLIANLEDGATLLASELEGRNLNIGAFVPDDSPFAGEVESVFLDLNDGAVTRRENAEPYTLFGDRSGNFFGGSLPAGTNNLSLDLYSDDRLAGDLLGTVERNFTIVDDLTGLDIGLFDTTTNERIATLFDGAEVDADLLAGGQSVTIAAVVSQDSPFAGQVESVFLNLNNGAVKKVENAEPYALFGDKGGNFINGSLPTGQNTIEFELYSEDRRQGELIDKVTVDFSIV
ncbi:MAG: 5'-nucleotidase, partial [Cyanobacteria bacterium P01_A01_bin.3]